MRAFVICVVFSVEDELGLWFALGAITLSCEE